MVKSMRNMNADIQSLQRLVDSKNRDIEELRQTHEPKINALLAQSTIAALFAKLGYDFSLYQLFVDHVGGVLC